MGFDFHYFLHLPAIVVFWFVWVVFQRVYSHVISVMLKVHHIEHEYHKERLDLLDVGVVCHSFALNPSWC